MARNSVNIGSARLLASAVLAAVACSDANRPEDRVLAKVEVTAGQDQSGVVGTELLEPLTVRALDADDRPVSGAVLNFRVVSGGGTVFAGATSTNADGIAFERWTLGTSTADAQRVEVRALDPNTGAPVVLAVFQATPLPDVATSLAVAAGDGQQAPSGAVVPDSLEVLARDRYGNPVPGVSVGWAASGGGSVNPATSTTNAAGIARTAWTLGSAGGAQTATATAVGLSGSPALFSAIGSPGPRVRVVTPPSDTARNRIVFARQPVVQLQDGAGIPLREAGVVVTASVSSGGGTMTGDVTAETNAEGIATFTDLAIQGLTGHRSVLFSAEGFAGDGTANVEVIAGDPATIRVNDGDSQFADTATTVPVAPSVLVTDADGNPVWGVAVTFSVAAGNGAITEADQVTNASGIARVGSWRLPNTEGLYTLGASASAVTGQVDFSARVPFQAVLITAGGSTQGGAADADHTCALRASGAAYCWGANTSGQLGDGTTTQRTTPVSVAGGLTFDTLTAGGRHTCGLTADGAAYCWGDNSFGQLGDGSTTDRALPVPVQGGLVFRSISAGDMHTCAVTTTGAGYCWGSADDGQLGNESSAGFVSAPTPVAGSIVFETISAGVFHSCGFASNGGAGYCWGDGFFGALGTGGTKTGSSSANSVIGGHVWRSISAAQMFTCGVTTSDEALCWGRGDSFQTGRGGTLTSLGTPTRIVGDLAWSTLESGGFHSCALTTALVAYCWGSGTVGQLGQGSTQSSGAPVPVAGGFTYRSVTAGHSHSCAVTTRGSALCWGSNGDGQLGDFVGLIEPAPRAVREP